jgi:hypothetical protein
MGYLRWIKLLVKSYDVDRQNFPQLSVTFTTGLCLDRSSAAGIDCFKNILILCSGRQLTKATSYLLLGVYCSAPLSCLSGRQVADIYVLMKLSWFAMSSSWSLLVVFCGSAHNLA